MGKSNGDESKIDVDQMERVGCKKGREEENQLVQGLPRTVKCIP
jgi:hypothetical protein